MKPGHGSHLEAIPPAAFQGDRLAANALMALASLIGLAAFLYPFILPGLVELSGRPAAARTVEAPLILAAVTGLSLAALLAQLGISRRHTANPAKLTALLGAVVALGASLRLIPSFGGASPLFLLIILVGAVFGARIGFLCGALTLLLSAFLTGGVGPWLPFQMIGAGWVGGAAAWLPKPRSPRRRHFYLVTYGVAAGLLYGGLLNLYSWPFAAPGMVETSSLYWAPGLGFIETIRRYVSFYLVTSLSHDAPRAVANGVLLLALGPPVLLTLERARRRLAWQQPTRVDSAQQQLSSPAPDNLNH